MSAVPLITTATSSTNRPSGCFSSHGSSTTSSPIRRSASTSVSCSCRARSMSTRSPRSRSYDDDSANELATRETSAKLYLKQLAGSAMTLRSSVKSAATFDRAHTIYNYRSSHCYVLRFRQLYPRSTEQTGWLSGWYAHLLRLVRSRRAQRSGAWAGLRA